MRAVACPTPKELANWLQGVAPDDSSADLEAHVETCEICRSQIERIESDDLLLAELKDLPPPAVDDRLDRECLAKITAAFRSDEGGPPSAYPARIRDYELVKLLGQGGMGAVFQARHLPLNRFVALKILPPGSGQRVARFQRELAHHGPLDHPHIVKALDAGEAEGVHFLVTELVEGRNAAQLVAEKGPLPVKEACAILRQAALGLAYLHQRGLVHRDVKPSNLMIDANGHVKLLDLGLVASSQDAPMDDRMTQDKTILGTPDYLAPEQIHDPRNVGPLADLYGLGCTLFHLLAGSPPFAELSLLQKLHAHQYEEPEMRRIPSPLTPELGGLLKQLLAKQTALRPATAASVAERLAAISSGASHHGGDVAPKPTPSRIPLPPSSPRGNHGVLVLLLAIVGLTLAIPLLVFVLAAAIWYLSPGGVKAPPAAPLGVDPIQTASGEGEERTTEPAAQINGDGDESQLAASVPPTEEKANSIQESTHPQSIDHERAPRRVGTPTPFRLGAHTQPVTALTFAPDGDTAYSAGAHQFEPLHTWDLVKRRSIETAAAGAVAVMIVHPSEPNQLLLGVAHRLVAWDRTKGSEIASLSCPGTVTSVASSAKTTIVVVGSDQGDVILWNPMTSARSGFLKLTGAISALAISDDGQVVAAATAEGQVTIWNAGKDEVLASLALRDRAAALGFAEDSESLFVVEGYSDRQRSTTQRVLRTDLTGEVQFEACIAEQGEMCLAAAIRADSLFVGCADGSVRSWRVGADDAVCQWRQKVHEQPVSALAISPDGQTLVSGARDGSVYLLSTQAR